MVIELKTLRETVQTFGKMEFDMWKGETLAKIDKVYKLTIRTPNEIGFKTNVALKEISEYSAAVENAIVPYLEQVKDDADEEFLTISAFVNRIKLELLYLPGDEDTPMPLMTNQFLLGMEMMWKKLSNAVKEVSSCRCWIVRRAP